MRAFGHLSGTPLEHAERLAKVQYNLEHLLKEFYFAREESNKTKIASKAVTVLIWWGMYMEANRTVSGGNLVGDEEFARQVDVVSRWLERK